MDTGDVLKEFSLYKSKQAPELRDSDCLGDIDSLTAAGWWKLWGYPFPNLQVLAVRLSSTHQGNGPSERDWSGRSVSKSKLRNKMGGSKHDKVHNVRQWLKEKVQIEGSAQYWKHIWHT